MKLSPLTQNRDFALAWLGGLVSMLGSWALWIALPLHVYEASGSALATSGVVAALVVPGILLGSVAGVFVDRWNRKTVLVVGNLLLAAGTLPLLAVGESRLWLVYPLVFLLEVVEQFTGPAEHALLPRLVPAPDLLAANALNALNNNLARLGGPALGGALYAASGLGAVVLVDVVSFLVAAVLLVAIRTSGAVRVDVEARDGNGEELEQAVVRRWRRVVLDWREGLGVVRRKRAVGVVFTVSALTSFGEGVFAVMFAVWVGDVLGGGVPELGLLQSSQAVGGLLGGVVAAYAARRLAPERLYGLGLLAFGIFDLALFNYPLVPRRRLDRLRADDPRRHPQRERAGGARHDPPDARPGCVSRPRLRLALHDRLAARPRRDDDGGCNRRVARADRAPQLPGRRLRRRRGLRPARARAPPDRRDRARLARRVRHERLQVPDEPGIDRVRERILAVEQVGAGSVHQLLRLAAEADVDHGVESCRDRSRPGIPGGR